MVEGILFAANIVIPAKAGSRENKKALDTGFRRCDDIRYEEDAFRN